jgi:Flp pilus assembly protein TadG
MLKNENCQQGQAIVEFAFVLPILCLLLLGIIEFGVLFYNKAMTTNASREGARTGITLNVLNVSGTKTCVAVPDADIEAAVNAYLESKLISFGDVNQINTTVTRVGNSPDCDLNPGTVAVDVVYQHSYLAIPRFMGLGNTIAINATTIMNRE